ncbi:MAG: N-acetylmuramoyl-L-alanine amidase [Chloroflexi bacterium]|jgi:N-acetylmuramoyl-L-alanine amidase|nr:N-acetylmuramoyl-L-alanine amidase [Chloroflexota bacterium]
MPSKTGSWSLFFRILGMAFLLATVFTLWPRPGQNFGGWNPSLALLLTPVASPQGETTRIRIGIVSGHMGNDSGAVCYDGNGNVTLTEAEVNQRIASLVQKKLQERGLEVDLLQEFDTRLNGYRAVALVSIHNDSCEYINEQATGFKVAAASNGYDPNRAARLAACLQDRYQRVTGLPFHPNTITRDMREYHAFSEIDPGTVAAIIETGFLYLDRDYLLNHTGQVAEGIVEGVLCFVYNENIETTPVP